MAQQEQHAHLQPAREQPPIILRPEVDPLAATAAWYLIHCLPLKEYYAATALQGLRGVPVYLPQVTRYFRGQVQHTPLFPRYLFVKVDLQTIPPSQINATPGIVRLVTFDEQPRSVPTSVMRALYEQVEHLNHQGGLPEQTLQPGDMVEITSGPLGGLEAIFAGPLTPGKRVRVLLEFMGRLNEVEMDRERLIPASSTQPLKRPRRTRGQGRRIKTRE